MASSPYFTPQVYSFSPEQLVSKDFASKPHQLWQCLECKMFTPEIYLQKLKEQEVSLFGLSRQQQYKIICKKCYSSFYGNDKYERIPQQKNLQKLADLITTRMISFKCPYNCESQQLLGIEDNNSKFYNYHELIEHLNEDCKKLKKTCLMGCNQKFSPKDLAKHVKECDREDKNIQIKN